MRTVIGALCGTTAMVALMLAPAAAAEEIICGRIMGFSAATATAPGSFVIPQPGDVAPAGTYIVIPKGTEFTAPGTAWVCVRTSESPPTQVFGGFTSTRTFVEFVPPGSPGYRAEPTPAPTPSRSPGGTGALPSTSTARTDMVLALALFASAVLGLGGAYLLLRR